MRCPTLLTTLRIDTRDRDTSGRHHWRRVDLDLGKGPHHPFFVVVLLPPSPPITLSFFFNFFFLKKEKKTVLVIISKGRVSRRTIKGLRL